MRDDTKDIPLGTHLRILRDQAGYSIRELARKVGVHNSYLSRLESGETAHPSPELLQRLADALGADSTELLTYLGVRPELPEPRAYFRRKLGVDADEAEILARLIENHQAKKRRGGHHEEETN